MGINPDRRRKIVYLAGILTDEQGYRSIARKTRKQEDQRKTVPVHSYVMKFFQVIQMLC